MTIRCIAVDDEPLARQGLKLSLDAFEGFELVGAYGDVTSALGAAHDTVDVVFLDIEMPGGQGFELLSRWPGRLPIVVFVTAYNQYAVKAFEAEALDYLMKPIDDRRFAQTIERLRAQFEAGDAGKRAAEAAEKVKRLEEQLVRREAAIKVKTEAGYHRVNLSDLLYIEAAGDHTFLYVEEDHLVTRKPLRHYAEELAAHGFAQIHKSFLVNIAHIKDAVRLQFGDYELTLSNGKTLRLSRRFRAVLDSL